MATTGTDPTADIRVCHEQTDELVESLDETTELLADMADSMAALSDTYEQMWQTSTQGAETRYTHQPGAAD